MTNADDGRQTWRVVLADGSVREVVVTHLSRNGIDRECWKAHDSDGYAFFCDNLDRAISRATRGLCVREILAPGEPTRAELVAQRDALRAIVRGRTTPPTRAEFDALGAAGGCVRYVAAGGNGSFPATPSWWGSVLDLARGGARWWAWDVSGAPCAWPVVGGGAR